MGRISVSSVCTFVLRPKGLGPIELRSFAAVLVLLTTIAASGCAGKAAISAMDHDAKFLSENASAPPSQLQTFDGHTLTVRSHNADQAKAILITLHGMNDYGHAFDAAGRYWSDHGLTVYSLDQRSFGALQPGEVSIAESWPGTELLVSDVRALVVAARTQHPDLPVFVLGHSMGGAVTLLANASGLDDVSGIILAAPAVWGGRQMPWIYRATLRVASAFAPGKTLTGARAKRRATDNDDVLKKMFHDPLVIKGTPLRSIRGIVSLMGEANEATREQSGRILFLYGERDEIIPIPALKQASENIALAGAGQTVKSYPDGWHLLFRDHQADVVWGDVLTWVLENSEPVTK